jgi:hypothetical protein
MSLTKANLRPHLYEWPEPEPKDVLEQLRFAAACKLCKWQEHTAGGGSFYITVGGGLEEDDFGLKLRFGDHENTSAQHDEPNFNFVGSNIDSQSVKKIIKMIAYPRLSKITAFAMHVGLTVPKLKKLLTEECYESICENEFAYPNTFTRFVIVAPALDLLEKAGVTSRFAVRQEGVSMEDYAGW